MTILTSIILVVAVVAIAAFIAYNMQRGTKSMSEFKADYDNNAEVQEVVELAKELYNKDLRPIVTKKAPEKAVENTTVVTTPEVVEKVVEEIKKDKQTRKICKGKKTYTHHHTTQRNKKQFNLQVNTLKNYKSISS